MKEKISPIAMGDAAGIDEGTWLKWRQHGPGFADERSENYIPVTVGGSDVAAIFNVSPWKTCYELYHQKIGAQPALEKQFNADSKALGHIFEDAISDAFMYWYRKNYPHHTIRKQNDTCMYRCGKTDSDGGLKYPWAVANLDRRIWINGVEGILEIKMTSDRNIQVIKEWQSGIVPIYYELQCRYYMAVMDVGYCYICCAWGLRLDQMAVVKISRDMEIEDRIMEVCAQFVEDVEQEFEPDPNDGNAALINEYYYRLYGMVDKAAPPIELPEKYRGTVLAAMAIEDEIVKKKTDLKKAEMKREEIYRALYPIYGNSSYGSFRLSESKIVSITLKTPMTRSKFDEDRLIKEHPEILEEYGKVVVDKEKLKTENSVLYRDYTIPPQPSSDPEKKNSFELKVKEIDPQK